MIRKVYRDFIRDKASKGDIRWLFRRGVQYALTHASYFLGRPLCGPILGTLVTNYNCNYRCSMCDLPLRDGELRAGGLKEFATGQMKQVLRDFAVLGTSGIGFTGGEPLLRKDIFELLTYSKDLGMFSHLNTNGSLLDDRNIQNILAARVDSINVSLDGACARTHDAIRGVPGAFERAVRGIERLVTARGRAAVPLRVKTVAVLQENNADEVEELVQLAKKLKVDCIEFIPRQPFRESDDWIPDARFMDKIRAIERYLIEHDDPAIKIENSPAHIMLFDHSFQGIASPLTCYSGYNSLAVDCFGEVYPCVPWYNWRMSAGNIRENGLRIFWISAHYNDIRKGIAGCRKCYLNCQTELNLLFNIRRSHKRTIA